MTTTNNNITLNLVDANDAGIHFIYDKATHEATFDYGLGSITWNASCDFFKAITTIDMDSYLYDGDEAFTEDCETPFYSIYTLDEDGNPDGWDFLVGQETLDEGLAWVKKIHNATLYAEGKERARQEAIEWSSDFANHNYSWSDLAEWGDYFTRLGKRYGLMKEFHENGIA